MAQAISATTLSTTMLARERIGVRSFAGDAAVDIGDVLREGDEIAAEFIEERVALHAIASEEALEFVGEDAGADSCTQVQERGHHRHQTDLRATEIRIRHRGPRAELVAIAGEIAVAIVALHMGAERELHGEMSAEEVRRVALVGLKRTAEGTIHDLRNGGQLGVVIEEIVQGDAHRVVAPTTRVHSRASRSAGNSGFCTVARRGGP